MLEAGEAAEAAKFCAMTRDLIAEVDESFGSAELSRLEARLAAQAGETARAEALLETAIDEATSRSHAMFHLRAATDLARLRGDVEGVRAALSAIAPGDCLPECAAADALLDQVAVRS